MPEALGYFAATSCPAGAGATSMSVETGADKFMA
jgi:hypothetical protein